LLGVSDQTTHAWRKQHLIDTGREPGMPGSANAELVAVSKRKGREGCGGAALRLDKK
jgi:hypothetical protein